MPMTPHEIAAAAELATPDCSTCHGEGVIADSDDREPWSLWVKLPPGSDMAVTLGLVQPQTCICVRTAVAEDVMARLRRDQPTGPITPPRSEFSS